MPYGVERNIDVGGLKRKVTHLVYTKEEADEEGIVYVGKKEVTEAGQWVLTDDGFVGQVLYVNGPYPRRKGGTGKKSLELTLSFCKVWAKAKTLEFLPFWKAKRFCRHTTKMQTEIDARRTRFKIVAKKYAWLKITQRGVIEKDQLMELAREYRPKDKIPMAGFMMTFKSRAGRKVIKEALKEIMEECGITPDFVIRQQQEIIEEARTEGQLNVAERANSKFIDMLDMMPDKQTHTEVQQLGAVSWQHLQEAPPTPELTEISVEDNESTPTAS